MFPNPDAMLMVMLAGSPASIPMEADIDSDDRYERLFARRDEIVNANVQEADVSVNDALMAQIIQALETDFPEMIEVEDIDRGSEIISGLFANPREIDDLTESQIEAIEDTAVNVGLVRTLLRSYGVKLSEEFMSSRLWLEWVMKYRRFMVA